MIKIEIKKSNRRFVFQHLPGEGFLLSLRSLIHSLTVSHRRRLQSLLLRYPPTHFLSHLYILSLPHYLRKLYLLEIIHDFWPFWASPRAAQNRHLLITALTHALALIGWVLEIPVIPVPLWTRCVTGKHSKRKGTRQSRYRISIVDRIYEARWWAYEYKWALAIVWVVRLFIVRDDRGDRSRYGNVVAKSGSCVYTLPRHEKKEKGAEKEKRTIN